MGRTSCPRDCSDSIALFVMLGPLDKCLDESAPLVPKVINILRILEGRETGDCQGQDYGEVATE